MNKHNASLHKLCSHTWYLLVFYTLSLSPHFDEGAQVCTVVFSLSFCKPGCKLWSNYSNYFRESSLMAGVSRKIIKFVKSSCSSICLYLSDKKSFFWKKNGLKLSCTVWHERFSSLIEFKIFPLIFFEVGNYIFLLEDPQKWLYGQNRDFLNARVNDNILSELDLGAEYHSTSCEISAQTHKKLRNAHTSF